MQNYDKPFLEIIMIDDSLIVTASCETDIPLDDWELPII